MFRSREVLSRWLWHCFRPYGAEDRIRQFDDFPQYALQAALVRGKELKPVTPADIPQLIRGMKNFIIFKAACETGAEPQRWTAEWLDWPYRYRADGIKVGDIFMSNSGRVMRLGHKKSLKLIERLD